MTKEQFLSKLADELTRAKVSDAADILGEYRQHFAFRTADGHSEEEIAAKLGDPAMLASQFEGGHDEKPGRGFKAAALVGLGFADLFAGIVFVLLIAWGIVMAALSLASGALAVCLFTRLNIASLIPPMPYWIAVVYGLSFSAFAVLVAVGCVYYAAFVRQLTRFYRRFHHNTVSAAAGKAVLPSLAIHPQLSVKPNRRIRSVALASLAIFAVFTVLGLILSMISAGAFEYWHAWGWFGQSGAD